MQLVNGEQFLNIIFWFILFEAVAASVFWTVIVPLAYMYALLWSHLILLSKFET